jgi:hypothetical protein
MVKIFPAAVAGAGSPKPTVVSVVTLKYKESNTLHPSTKVKKTVPLSKRETTRARRKRNAWSLFQASLMACKNRRNITTRPTKTTPPKG